MNQLAPQNCNKAKCKTCIFGNTPVHLSKERINEIHLYLAKFEASHICHTTNLTCYGALEFQAKILHAMGLINNNTVESMLAEAAKYIKVLQPDE
jgi:hypothetical protein